mgnify:CR=1 FL=1
MTSKNAIERLAGIDQGMISDCMIRLGIDGWMDGLQAAGEAASFAGPARTILLGPRRGIEALPMSKYAVMAKLEPGDVLVLAGVETRENQMGDNVARFGQMRGIAAIVCDAPVRDYAGMGQLSIPVFCKGRSARMPLTTEAIAFDVPVMCAGAQVRPGDIVVGSSDGLLVVPGTRVDDILYQLDDMEQIETTLQAAIRDGRPLAEIEALAGKKKKLRARAAA